MAPEGAPQGRGSGEGEGYLRGVLADGARRFRHRGGVRALLGVPEDTGVRVHIVPPVPRVAFAYLGVGAGAARGGSYAPYRAEYGATYEASYGECAEVPGVSPAGGAEARDWWELALREAAPGVNGGPGEERASAEVERPLAHGEFGTPRASAGAGESRTGGGPEGVPEVAEIATAADSAPVAPPGAEHPAARAEVRPEPSESFEPSEPSEPAVPGQGVPEVTVTVPGHTPRPARSPRDETAPPREGAADRPAVAPPVRGGGMVDEPAAGPRKGRPAVAPPIRRTAAAPPESPRPQTRGEPNSPTASAPWRPADPTPALPDPPAPVRVVTLPAPHGQRAARPPGRVEPPVSGAGPGTAGAQEDAAAPPRPAQAHPPAKAPAPPPPEEPRRVPAYWERRHMCRLRSGGVLR
ncbi:hypothetical protein [Streptomyces sp. ODS28]|uniref:hypothetical protein n=1 Tax=Streptomyces sp. ODS28 TaxID=3136688 RepID=UPI0031E8B059